MKTAMIFLLLLFSWTTQAASTVTVPALKIQNLESYKGQYLTVYYAMGSRGTFATSGDQVHIREVKARSTFRITQDSLTTGPMVLNKWGFQTGYNLVVFVVHSDPQFSWTNADGQSPSAETSGGSSESTEVDSILRKQLEAQGQNPVVVNFGRWQDPELNRSPYF